MSSSKKSVIAFTGGGTAGHVFPALPVAERLRKAGHTVFWIGSKGGKEEQWLNDAQIPFYGIPSGKLRRYFSWQNFTDMFRIIGGIFCAIRYLRREKPALLFSKGGFVSVPPVAAAKWLGIPTFTHESDFDPGLATRLNLKLGARPLLAYEETKAYLSAANQKQVSVVGNPIRDALFSGSVEEGRRLAGLAPDDSRPLLFVMGGSQGAREINDLITQSLDQLLEHVAIVHQFGEGNSQVQARPGYLPLPFIHNELPHFLAAANLAVARSGASAVWELAATKTPAIYVPLRSSSRGDQIRNALRAEKAGISKTLPEGASWEDFVSLVLALSQDQVQLESMTKNLTAYPARDAADTIVKILGTVLT